MPIYEFKCRKCGHITEFLAVNISIYASVVKAPIYRSFYPAFPSDRQTTPRRAAMVPARRERAQIIRKETL